MRVPFKAQNLQPFVWIFIFLSALFLLDFFQAVDFREKNAIDFRFRLRGAQPAHPDILLVEIDDGSLKALGQWPWPRGLYARLLDILAEHKPAAVFFDILFTEASANPGQDQALADATRKLGNVVLPFYYASLDPFEAFFPLPIFAQAAGATGFVNVDPDSDGVTRSLRISIDGDGKAYYSPAFLILGFRYRETYPERMIERLPRDQQTKIRINYPGPVSAYRRLSFQAVLQLAETGRQAELEELFRNRIVIVGHTATGTTDLRPTPFSPADVGLSVQAACVHTLLSGRYMHALPPWAGFLLLQLLCLPLAWIVMQRSLRVGLTVFAAAVAGYLALNFWMFTRTGWALPVGVPVAGLAATVFMALLFKFLSIRMQGELLSRELEMASKIQETFLPGHIAEDGVLDMAWDHRFLKSVGGDLFDWVKFEGPRRGVVIGDVSGKGMPAALYMAKAISEFRRENKQNRSPAEVCRALNQACLAGGATGLFLTLIYAVLDPLQQKIAFAVAGHEAMIYYQASSRTAFLAAKEGGPPLGLFEDADYALQEIPFAPGDFFMLITDGLREMRNPKGEEFGMERLCRLAEICGRERRSAAETIERLRQAWSSFQNGTPAHDDYTVICVRFPPVAEKS